MSDGGHKTLNFRAAANRRSLDGIVRHGVKLSLASMGEKALKCQRSATGSDSQPEPYQVARLERAAAIPYPLKGTPAMPNESSSATTGGSDAGRKEK